MTTWSKPDNEGVTRRKVGKHRLRADINGWWAVLTEEMNGTATDLASAQAAADTAVEKLLAEADADFGLRFIRHDRSDALRADLARVTADRDALDVRWSAEVGHANKWAAKFRVAESDLASARQEAEALRATMRVMFDWSLDHAPVVDGKTIVPWLDRYNAAMSTLPPAPVPAPAPVIRYDRAGDVWLDRGSDPSSPPPGATPEVTGGTTIWRAPAAPPAPAALAEARTVLHDATIDESGLSRAERDALRFLLTGVAAQHHTQHCIARQAWGDGECECKPPAPDALALLRELRDATLFDVGAGSPASLVDLRDRVDAVLDAAGVR